MKAYKAWKNNKTIFTNPLDLIKIFSVDLLTSATNERLKGEMVERRWRVKKDYLKFNKFSQCETNKKLEKTSSTKNVNRSLNRNKKEC